MFRQMHRESIAAVRIGEYRTRMPISLRNIRIVFPDHFCRESTTLVIDNVWVMIPFRRNLSSPNQNMHRDGFAEIILH